MTDCTELRAVLSAPPLSCLSSAVPDTDSKGGPLSKVHSCLPVSLSTATTFPSSRLTSRGSLQGSRLEQFLHRLMLLSNEHLSYGRNLPAQFMWAGLYAPELGVQYR